MRMRLRLRGEDLEADEYPDEDEDLVENDDLEKDDEEFRMKN